MASKKPQKQDENPLTNIIVGIVGAIIVMVAAFFGINLSVDDAGTGLPDAPARATPIPQANPTPIPQDVSTGGQVHTIQFQQGFGARKDFWQVYFTAPTGSTDASTYVGGVDQAVLDAMNSATRTLDIAAFEWNLPHFTEAVLAAKNRGVTVRMVVDDEHAVESSSSTMKPIIDSGIPVTFDIRTAFMHNKFMIIDGRMVITGSTNFTWNDMYRNNNNMLFMRHPEAVRAYQTEFDQMFGGTFGPRKTAHETTFTANGVTVRILFAPSGNVVGALLEEIQKAQRQIRFMTFSFTLVEVGDALVERFQAGVDVAGIFELRGSQTASSELFKLVCAGMDARQDGNSFTFHHKVFIIDDHTVVTGSFNISQNATRSNDENLVIIRSPDVARLYLEEYARVYTQSRVTPPDRVTCN